MQLAFVLYPGVTALDVVGPYEVLRTLPGAELRFVAERAGPVVTDSGVLVLGATHTFDETPAPDLLLVPGSSAGTAAAMANPALRAWLRAAHRTTRFTTSVCSGALILAAADILRGLPATTHWFAQDFFAPFGVRPQRQERIVRAGKVVTAAGVSAGIDLALFLVGEIAGRERAEVSQLLVEYDPRPPFDAGHPSRASERVRELARAEMARDSLTVREMAALPVVLWRTAIERVRAMF